MARLSGLDALQPMEADMADDKKTATDADAIKKAEADAAKAQKAADDQAQADAAKATEDARSQDEKTNAAQADSVPYPSQEEADRMKASAGVGAAPYLTRDLKA